MWTLPPPTTAAWTTSYATALTPRVPRVRRPRGTWRGWTNWRSWRRSWWSPWRCGEDLAVARNHLFCGIVLMGWVVDTLFYTLKMGVLWTKIWVGFQFIGLFLETIFGWIAPEGNRTIIRNDSKIIQIQAWIETCTLRIDLVAPAGVYISWWRCLSDSRENALFQMVGLVPRYGLCATLAGGLDVFLFFPKWFEPSCWRLALKNGKERTEHATKKTERTSHRYVATNPGATFLFSCCFSVVILLLSDSQLTSHWGRAHPPLLCRWTMTAKERLARESKNPRWALRS